MTPMHLPPALALTQHLLLNAVGLLSPSGVLLAVCTYWEAAGQAAPPARAAPHVISTRRSGACATSLLRAASRRVSCAATTQSVTSSLTGALSTWGSGGGV
jgi:hypothetical protein